MTLALRSGGDRDGAFPTGMLWSRIGHDSLPKGTSLMSLVWFVIYKGPHLDMRSQIKGTAEVRAGGRVALVRELVAMVLSPRGHLGKRAFQ